VLHPDIGIGAADPQEAPRIIFARFIADELADGENLGQHADDGAVAWRQIVEIIGADDAAGARHVLNDDLGLAGQMDPKMARHQPSVEIVAAARFRGDDEGERSRPLLGGRRTEEKCSSQQQARGDAHAAPPEWIVPGQAGESIAPRLSAAPWPD